MVSLVTPTNTKEELTAIFLKLFSKIEKKGTFPYSFHEANITML